MAIKGYSAFPKAPALLEPHHQIILCYIQDTRLRGSYPSAEMLSVYTAAPTNLRYQCITITNVVMNRIFYYKPITISETIKSENRFGDIFLLLHIAINICNLLYILSGIVLLRTEIKENSCQNLSDSKSAEKRRNNWLAGMNGG